MTLHFYTIPLKWPFRISAGMITHKTALLLEVRSDDIVGWGEAAVDEVPFYAHETVGSVADILRKTLFPLLHGGEFSHPDEVTDKMNYYRGNHFAKAAVDAAVWDIYGKRMDRPVWQLLGGTRTEIESAPTIGIKNSPEEALAETEEYLAKGNARIKLKVAPGYDTRYLELIRERHPAIRLMADANSAYKITDAEHLAGWDPFNLLMMEQPLQENDIYFHSLLRKKIKTPICLDESIHDLHDAECCCAMESADSVNIKVCRVGGLTNSRRMHDICASHGVKNWIGGRFGFGVAVAPRIAAATLPNCSLPTDCVNDLDYMIDDILEIPFSTDGGYMMKSPMGAGLGFKVDRRKLSKYTTSTISL